MKSIIPIHVTASARWRTHCLAVPQWLDAVFAALFGAGAVSTIRAVETPPTVTYAAAADAQTVATSPGTKYGTQASFSVGAAAGAESIRSYLRFDLSSIPANAQIHSAQLEVFAADVSATGTRRAQVFLVSAPWAESSISWSTQPAVSGAGVVKTLVVNQWNTWNVTAFVNAWVSGGASNHGIALRPVVVAGQSFSTLFRSREATTNQPRLLVSYSPPLSAATTTFMQLSAESATPPTIYYNAGVPTSVQMQWPLPADGPEDPLLRALDFLDRFRALYALSEPRTQLTPRRRETSAAGRHVLFEQIHEGIPVYGSQLAVHLTKTHVIGTGGRWLAELPLLPPATLTAAQAGATARIWVKERGAVNPEVMGESHLVWLNPSLFGSGPNQTWLAWRVSVSGLPEGKGAGFSVFIDGHTGARRWLLNQIRDDHAQPEKDFLVYTANGYTMLDCGITDNATEWFNTAGPTGYPGAAADPLLEGMKGWNFLHSTYDYYFNTFHRLSWDDCDMEMPVYTHGDFNNAFFSPNCCILAFSDGRVVNDTFAHEYTHGVTHFTAGLIYADQSGALDESISDVFGAMIDTGDWLYGEDQPGGPRCSLEDPPSQGQPRAELNFSAEG